MALAFIHQTVETFTLTFGASATMGTVFTLA